MNDFYLNLKMACGPAWLVYPRNDGSIKLTTPLVYPDNKPIEVRVPPLGVAGVAWMDDEGETTRWIAEKSPPYLWTAQKFQNAVTAICLDRNVSFHGDVLMAPISTNLEYDRIVRQAVLLAQVTAEVSRLANLWSRLK